MQSDVSSERLISAPFPSRLYNQLRMNIDKTLEILLYGNQLKRTPRTGWLQRGVSPAESVAAHSHGVAFVALVLSRLVDESLDLGRTLAMAALHDLPESLTSDIPTPSWRYLPPGSKRKAEMGAMRQIVAGSELGPEFMALWEEMRAAETAEARLVKDADKLDLFMQALAYEEQSANRRLGEFWDAEVEFFYSQSRVLYDALRAKRASWKHE
jgi:putative hydrolase of HD superfamily